MRQSRTDIRQSRPDSGLDFQVNVFKPVASSIGIGPLGEARWSWATRPCAAPCTPPRREIRNKLHRQDQRLLIDRQDRVLQGVFMVVSRGLAPHPAPPRRAKSIKAPQARLGTSNRQARSGTTRHFYLMMAQTKARIWP